MKKLILTLLLAISAVDIFAAAGRPPAGGGFNPFNRGGSPIGGGGSSSSSSSGSITNLPDYALTNNQTTPVTLGSDLTVGGTIRGTSALYSNAAAAGSMTLYDANGITGLTFTATSQMFSNLVIRFPSAGTNGLFQLVNDGSATNWALVFTPLSEVSWRSNFVAASFGSFSLTNQILYAAGQNYNGSNGVTATALTNIWDMQASIFKPVTNVVGTNLTYHLSNIVQGASIISHFKGISSYSNRISFIIPSGGSNIVWQNWATNGTWDITVRPGFTYTVNFFATSQTNIVGTIATDDAYQPFKVVTLLTPAGFTSSNAIVGGTMYKSIVVGTNLNTTIATLTNLATCTITGHTLTNNGDELFFESRGKVLAGSNSFTVTLGNTTLLATGTITNGATDYQIEGTITRTGNGSQQSNTRFTWGPGNGVAYHFTNNFLVDTAQSNGHPATVLAITGGSMRAFGISNLYMRVQYLPAPRL